jgi:hypothetical protein
MMVQDQLIEQAKQLTGLKTNQAVVEKALRVLILVYEREKARGVSERQWAEAFQGSATPFIDQLIDDNEELFAELARR